MKRTRIFEVEYNYVERFNGRRNGDAIKGQESVVARNAGDAVNKVGKMLSERRDIVLDNDEKSGKIIVTAVDYDPINVTLQASA